MTGNYRGERAGPDGKNQQTIRNMNQITSLSQLKKIKFNKDNFDDSDDSHSGMQQFNNSKEMYSPKMQIIIKSKSPKRKQQARTNTENIAEQDDEEIMQMEEMPL